MSKSKIAIATLGTVAALGVAALPLMSYATGPSVTGNVQLDVEVLPAIAMTISGNNDGGTHKQTGDSTSFGAIDVFSDGTGTTGKVDGHTVSASTTTTSSSYTSILPNAKVDGNASNGFGSTVTVYTNNSAGYTLAIKDDDSTLDLVNENSDTIPAMVTGSADPTDDTTIEAGTAAWAYQLQKSDGTDVVSPAYAAITASDVTIVTRNTETSGGSQNFIGYGVSTASDQATGIYKDTIVYTATCQ